MDEKTAALRDLFVDATGSETVTERQEETPGSLVDRDDEAVDERVAELVAVMRDRCGFDGGSDDPDETGSDDPDEIGSDDTGLDDAALVRVARGFFEDEDDMTVASDLGVDAATVRDARLNLHLVAEADRDAPFENAELKRSLAAERPIEDCAAALDADPETVREYVPVARADLASTRVNGRFRDGFRALLTDADVEESFATAVREDGLREAIEDIETDVSL